MAKSPLGDIPDLSAEWPSIVRHLRDTGAADMRYEYFSKFFAIDWPKTRIKDPICLQLRQSWSEMLALKGRERAMLSRTCANMRAIAEHTGWKPPSVQESKSSQAPKGVGDAPDWESLVGFLRSAGAEQRCYGDYADSVDIDWPRSRFYERLAPLLRDNIASLSRLASFGPKKIARTYDNLRAIALHLGWSPDDNHRPAVPAVKATLPTRPSMAQYGLPESLPVEAAFLSQRSRDYCSSDGIETLADLAEKASSPNWDPSTKKCQNMGRKSVAEIARLSAALRSGHKTAVKEFLPIRILGNGLDFGAAAAREAQAHQPIGVKGMHRRLVLGKTLEQVAEEFPVTRERVRQVEMCVLQRIETLLAASPVDRAIFWQDWLEHGRLRTVGSECGIEADSLGAAVIDRVFGESEEGKKAAAESDNRCELLCRELVLQKAFYTGELKLADFLPRQSLALTMERLTEWNERRHAFSYDESSGVARAICPKAKQIILALVAGRSVPAAEVLEFLRRAGFGEEWTIADLRKAYLRWCEEPSFPKSGIQFPAPETLKSRADLIAQLARARGMARQTVARPRPGFGELAGPAYQELAALDRRLQSILAASHEAQSLFGLLPVKQDLQSAAINALKQVVAGKIESLLQCLRRLPCVTGYVLVIGPGSKMEAQAFFEPLEKYLGFSIPQGRRNELTSYFKEAGKQLGLLPVPVRERTDNVGPIVFQAAIIPRFVDVLVPAILKELERVSSPDIEDVDEVARFAERVASHIELGQARLRRVLGGDAGVAVCRILLRAYQTNDFAQLPPHLETRCAEAFRDVGMEDRHFLKSPYILFDGGAGEFFLVLPRQSQHLVRPDTFWRVGSSQLFSAAEETRIPLLESYGTSVNVELSPLASDNARQFSHLLETGPSTRQPVWIFDANTGRRAQYKPENDDGIETLRLPGGRDFYIVATQPVASDIAQDAWRECGNGLKSLLYESCWGQEEILLTMPSGQQLRIACRKEPSILVTPARGGRLQLVQGDFIFYGAEAHITLIAPQGDGEALEPHSLRILSAGEEEVKGSEDELQRHFAEFSRTLADGIHRIELEFAANGKTVRRGFYFWKGLDYLDYAFGFRCSRTPQNFDWATSRGIAEDHRGVRLLSTWLAPEVDLGLKSPPVVLSVKRPGITFSLLDTSTGIEESCELGRLVHVPPHDPRRVVIRLEVSGKWELRAGKCILKRTDDGSMRAIFRLDDLIPEGGNSTVLTASPDGAGAITIMRLQRQIAVTGSTVVSDVVERRYYVSFTVPPTLKNIAIVRSVLLPCGEEKVNGEKTLVAVAPGIEIEGLAGLPNSYLVKRWDRDGGEAVFAELFVPYDSLQANWHVLELLYLDEKGGEWSELHAADANDAYGSRWIFAPPVDLSVSDDFVTAVLRLAQNRSDLAARKIPDPPLPTGDRLVHDAYEVLEGLLDYQYSPAGWESVKWASEGFFWLSQRAQESFREVLGQRAVNGLALRARQREGSYRPLHFGSSELACTMPGRFFSLPAYPPGVVGDCFRLIGRRAQSGSTIAMLRELMSEAQDSVAIWPFTHFANAAKVFSERADCFLNLNLGNLLRDIGKRIVAYDPHTNDLGAGIGLAEGAWAAAQNATEKRLIRLRSRQHNETGPLNEITGFKNRQHHLEAAVLKVLRYQPGNNTEWTDLPGSEHARDTLQLVFWIAALGRATSHGWFRQDEYVSTLGQVFSGGVDNRRPVRQGLSLCVGLAPEWFALAMLLWEVILPDAQGTVAQGKRT